MPLDTYRVREDVETAKTYRTREGFVVTRYKSLEKLESMGVAPGMSVQNTAIQKRLRVVDQYKKDGRPKLAIYWFEADGTISGQTFTGFDAPPNPGDDRIDVAVAKNKQLSATTIRGLDRVINGTLYAWIGPKLVPLPTPPAYSSVATFDAALRAMWVKDRATAQDWIRDNIPSVADQLCPSTDFINAPDNNIPGYNIDSYDSDTSSTSVVGVDPGHSQ